MAGKPRQMPSVEVLRATFSYDPCTGLVRRLVNAPKCPAGTVVGTPNSAGGLICRINYQIVYVHRIAWALYYGCEPPPLIDHINGNPADNRITNLRAATAQQNTWNRGAQHTSQSGIKGAHWSSVERRWRSSIKINGKSHHLGWFDSCEEAAAAYRVASAKIHGEFARFD